MPLDPERVQALFLAAAELADPTERAPFLDRECANNPELRRRLLVLLKAHDDSGNLPPADDLTGAFKPAAAILKGALSAGQVFAGRYKLREKLGEGGMGEVWVADQSEPVQRRIALKVIKTGLDSARLLARFEQERQALALMDHPNIAKVLDAGVSDDGQSYFVMELVKGLSLTKYCDDARLSPKERLELFIPVCQAVQHAHQKGIIHRDLKPSNILIGLYDGRPVPKVIDFGVAKATGPRLSEQSIYTEVGALVGTLEYMSPEQAELNNLDIDTRADIYSLGVVLYELLTGSPPFTRQQLRSAAFTEMLRIIREVEPPKPSARLSSSDLLPSIAAKRKLEPQRLTRLVHGDLDWIVMKCLEKDRGRRYETANGLALDVLRYLHEEPVLAGPPSARYRLRKFVRRNRGPVLAAAGSAALVLLGIGGLIAGLVALEAEQRHTKEALQQVRVEQRHTAEALDQVQREQAKTQEALLAETAAKAQARKALDILTDDVVEKVFAKQPVLGETEKGFLRNVLKFYEQFTQELGDTPDARELRASGHFRVALIRYRLGQAADAETANRDALAIRKQLAADFPTVVPYRKDLATSYNNLGALLVATGRAREAETAYRDAVGIQKQLAADFPTATAYRYDLAGSQSNLGLLLANTGRPKEAETAYRDALAIQKLLATDFPTVPAYRHELARCHSNLGVLFA
ncbi:MAG TPA: serine/threonine-protein kinase, partial [Gemmataceae bacterium]|nr:serine/threonine-protein kinase [Gemmataceae bacterium]